MNLNHLDLQVSDVTAAADFFQKFFGLRCTYQRRDQIALLEDEAGFSLAVSNLFGSPPPVYPADFHVGFKLDAEADLRRHYDLMRAAEVPMKAELSKGGPNLYFTCIGPDGIPVEVSAPIAAP